MTEPVFFSPYGTVSRTLRPPAPDEQAAHRFVTTVLSGRPGQELGAERVWLAWETARLLDAGPEARETFAWLVVVSLLYRMQGSTRLPVAQPGALEAALERMLPAGQTDATARASALANDIRALLDRPETRPLVAADGAFAPFLLRAGTFVHQRLDWQEERLIRHLRRLLTREPAEHDPAAVRVGLADILARPARRGGRAEGAPVILQPQQQYAVLAAALSPLSIISGGPGTGKTTIVVSMLRLLARLGVPVESVVLAAPTGKAAYRMHQAVQAGLEGIPDRTDADQLLRAGCPQPLTLHRLLGYSPGRDRFAHHENHPLAARVVIVDEASMIDLRLMDVLVRSLHREARLVLLGDPDQLPSVDAGAVLRDLMPDETAQVPEWAELLAAAPEAGTDSGAQPHPLARCTTRLAHSYRMDPSDPDGRAILLAAHAVRDGDTKQLFAADAESHLVPLAAGAPEFRGIGWLAPRVPAAERPRAAGGDAPVLDASVREFLHHWKEQRLRGLADYDELVHHTYVHDGQAFCEEDARRLARLFAHAESARLLCVTRVFPTGADAVNQVLRRLLDRDEDDPSAFRPGEPVMMQRNDYEKRIFNGDQGIVLRVGTPGSAPGSRGTPMVVFLRDGGFAPFGLATLQADLRLSYAMTVHKSQGSEFDHVALLLPDEDIPLLTREVLYTAMTRARRSVTLLGARELIEAAIGRPMERHTGIRERLLQYLA